MDQSIRPTILFSLPRAGSTLLQRMLAAHPGIATTAEPWLLLPYLSTLHRPGTVSLYSHAIAVKAISDFYDRLPGGRAEYLAHIRHMVLGLYRSAAGDQASHFLDKTPRYALLADDVIELFPDGRFIFLWRNPLAVVASIIQRWLGSKWIYPFKWDLCDGLDNLIRAHEQYRDRVLAVQFEELIAEPEAELRRLCDYLGLSFEPAMISGFADVQLGGSMGDGAGRRQYQQLSTQPLDKWREVLANPVRKAWTRRYLRWLGPHRASAMGYYFDELMRQLNSTPTRFGLEMAGDARRIALGRIYLRVRERLLAGRAPDDKTGGAISPARETT